jgi:hypothetical protein
MPLEIDMTEVRVTGTPIRFRVNDGTVFAIERMSCEHAVMPGDTWVHGSLGPLRFDSCDIDPDTGDVTVVYCSVRSLYDFSPITTTP